ncbi:YLL012W [Saccharomyces arboricola H-6]|uniref:sterol esterase n=1 Tax=Saccharomyces arboricola (strain H-6 / AS 2.3317 / CBS 10644) TaxID=1160507 RepID=J8Q582_SACAR|nr:YLL012W [Saccharomyces arboricola H-6]
MGVSTVFKKARNFLATFIVCCFMAVVLVLALARHFINEHRDTRSSSTQIEIDDDSKRNVHHDHVLTKTNAYSTPYLDLEHDKKNGIVYDHTRTVIRKKNQEEEGPLSLRKNLFHKFLTKLIFRFIEQGKDNEPLTQGKFNNSNNEIANHEPVFEKIPVCSDNSLQNLILSEDLALVADLNYYFNQYNIHVEEFRLETEDGFVIDLWHLVPKYTTVHMEKKKRPPVLMLHGLLQSSGSFASNGRKSLAYFLYQSGYDIWLGNNRCGFKPEWNDAKLPTSDSKWDWDLREMVKYDLTLLIDTVLAKSQFEKLTLISHSQGTTQGFMGLVNEDKIFPPGSGPKESFFTSKIANYIALAPAVYPGPLLDEKLFVKLMTKEIDNPWFFGETSFFEIMMIVRNLCIGEKLFSFVCYTIFNYLFDWNDTLWDAALRDRHFLFSPVHVSVKLMQWWLSPDPNKVTFKFGSHKMFPDNVKWFSDASKAPNIYLFVPKQDRLVDGERLINHFVNVESNVNYKIWYIDEYAHIDVLWAHDVIERIGKPIVQNLNNYYFKKPSSAFESDFSDTDVETELEMVDEKV